MKTTQKQPDNMGGVIRLWAIPREDITLNGNIPAIIREEHIVCLEITQDSTGAQINPKTDFSGTTYLHEISGFVPGYDEQTEKLINEMMRKQRYVLFYSDSEDTLVMLGRPEIPIRFSATFSTGENSTAQRGYKVTFSGNVHYPPIRVTANPFE